MKEQIEDAMNAKGFIENVTVYGGYVWFDMNGAEYSAKLVRGKFKADNVRRS